MNIRLTEEQQSLLRSYNSTAKLVPVGVTDEDYEVLLHWNFIKRVSNEWYENRPQAKPPTYALFDITVDGKAWLKEHGQA